MCDMDYIYIYIDGEQPSNIWMINIPVCRYTTGIALAVIRDCITHSVSRALQARFYGKVYSSSWRLRFTFGVFASDCFAWYGNRPNSPHVVYIVNFMRNEIHIVNVRRTLESFRLSRRRYISSKLGNVFSNTSLFSTCVSYVWYKNFFQGNFNQKCIN